ncbi:MAG: hypothetical protein L0H83_05025, partial [Salinisphaera sp.]|nr:hypothetical protein [Salinisphaera sp.]
MSDLHALWVYVDGFSEPLKLHGGFDGYDDPYRALAEYGFFKGERRGEIRVGDAHIHLRFRSQPER